MGELNQTSWSRIRRNNVVFTKDKENVGNGKLTGSVRKETNADCGTMNISVQNQRHSQLLLQNIRRIRMGKIQRERKVPEAEVHLVECLDGPARITLKVLARFHLVKSGILQSACSTGQKDGCKFGKSALSHTARLRNNPVKGQKGMATKVQCLCLIRERIWVVCFKTWSRRDRHRFYGRSQPCRNQSDVFDSPKPYCAKPTTETKIHCPTECAQEILISAAPTPQNLRIGLRKRRDGKSIGLAKQRGSWQRKS